ncbi:MAG TPA: hypothetical protein VMT17_02480 [Anaeromyxobacteraceae bacterium]|nr:hypothetical protein [Anaeromyxobacteraceae bacterium]
MTFRYRCLAIAPAAMLVAAMALSTAFLLLMPGFWKLAAVLPLPAAAAGAMLWLAQREEAWRLGAVYLDGSGVRRIRGDGRVIEVIHWDELRSVVVDFRHRQALFVGPDGASFWVRGMPLLGGVGLESFDSFLELLPDYTSAPVRQVERTRPTYSRIAHT